MNKIEKILDKIVSPAKKFNNNDPYGFTFLMDYNDESEIQLFFSMQDNSELLYLNFIKVREDANNQFNFELPISYVSNFIKKHINDKTYLNCLNYTVEEENSKIEIVYNQFLDKVNNSPNFIPIILPAILQNEISNKEVSDKKKLKM